MKISVAAAAASIIVLAVPAQAVPSACANLPLNGPVPATGGPTVTGPAAATPGGWQCPPGANRVPNTNPPMCARPAPTVVQGNPRAECYAALPFGPVSMIVQLARPIAGKCATRINNIPIRGRGVGFDDVVVTLAPMTGTTMVRLVDPLPTLAADSPVEQRCLGPDCRLMQLTTTAATPPTAVFSIGLPGRPPVTRTLNFASACPTPPPEMRCPPLGGTSAGGSPQRRCP